MKNKAKSNVNSISSRIRSYVRKNKRFVKWASALIILFVLLTIVTLYDVDNAKAPSGVITVSISGNGPTTVYTVSFLSLTSSLPIYDISLLLTGNSGTFTVVGFNVGAQDHYYNNATIYKTEIITSPSQPDNLSIGTHIFITGSPLSQVTVVETSTNGKIASYNVT